MDCELNEAYAVLFEKGGWADTYWMGFDSINTRISYILSKSEKPLSIEDILKEMPKKNFMDSKWIQNELNLVVGLQHIEEKNGLYSPSKAIKEYCDSFALENCSYSQ